MWFKILLFVIILEPRCTKSKYNTVRKILIWHFALFQRHEESSELWLSKQVKSAFHTMCHSLYLSTLQCCVMSTICISAYSLYLEGNIWSFLKSHAWWYKHRVSSGEAWLTAGRSTRLMSFTRQKWLTWHFTFMTRTWRISLHRAHRHILPRKVIMSASPWR